jgi:hypothetical protein
MAMGISTLPQLGLPREARHYDDPEGVEENSPAQATPCRATLGTGPCVGRRGVLV